MANEKLKSWLKNKDRDYQEGVELFKELKVNAKKEKFFNTDEPQAIHKNMLFAKLANFDRVYNQIADEKKQTLKAVKEEKAKRANPSKNLAEVREQIEVVNKEIENGRVVIDKGLKVKYDDMPKELQTAYDKNGELYSEVKSLHAKMKAVPADAKNDSERKEYANLVLDKFATIKDNWVKIDDWAKGKPAPEPTQPIEASGKYTKAEIEAITDPVIQAQSKDKRIEANLAYIRRSADDETKKEKVDERIAELKAWDIDYEKRIGKN